MALTRKMLQAMEIPAEKIDEIISAHTESISALKDEKDKFKDDAEKLPEVQKKLDAATKELEQLKGGEWESKYTSLKAEYDGYKADVEKKAVKTAKENAYKQLLADAGISDKRIASILKVSAANVEAVELDADGKIKDSDKLTDEVKKEWADFIVTKQEQGATVPNPAENNGSGVDNQPSRAAQMVAKYQSEHYGSLKKD